MGIVIERGTDGKWSADIDGVRHELANCNVTLSREPERDHDAEDAAKDGYVQYKPGPEAKLLIEATYLLAPPAKSV